MEARRGKNLDAASRQFRKASPVSPAAREHLHSRAEKFPHRETWGRFNLHLHRRAIDHHPDASELADGRVAERQQSEMQAAGSGNLNLPDFHRSTLIPSRATGSRNANHASNRALTQRGVCVETVSKWVCRPEPERLA